MPRGPRLDTPGALHHVMARGLDRQVIFRDDRDRADFVRRLAALAEGGAWLVYAWALLPNHFHLLVRTAKRSLARTMRSLLTGYAGTFNRRHRRRGHLFQNRYKSIVVEEESYLLELVRYLHLNPLRANVVPTLRALDRYPYSGHAAVLGTRPCPWQNTGEVLRRFGHDRARARARYRAFVADGVGTGRRPDLMGGGLVRSAGGWAAVRELRRGRESYAADERVLGGGEFVDTLLREVTQEEARRARGKRRAPDLPALMAKVARAGGVTPEALMGGGRRRDVGRARDALAYLWVEVLGRSGRQLAQELHIRPESVYKGARRGREEGEWWRGVGGV
ncbi:MAG: transposase [candidate division NC10 bacterium]|nr:transposase [candidate division NC10 bacterium]